MRNLFVLLAISVAAFFVGRRFIKSLRSDKTFSCDCGCSGAAANFPAHHQKNSRFKPTPKKHSYFIYNSHKGSLVGIFPHCL